MHFMNKSLLNIAGALLLAFAVTNVSLADPINGKITFAGGMTLDSSNPDTATAVTSWVNSKVQSSSGDFATFASAGDAVAFNAPWSFNSGAISNFWSVDGFTFDLISSTILSQGSGFLNVIGVGTASGHGFDPYVGTWRFSTQDDAGDGGVFSFSASSSVPDSGTTAMLIGAVFFGMSLFVPRRKTA